MLTFTGVLLMFYYHPTQGAGVSRRALSRARRAFRQDSAQHASLGRALDGDRGLAAHVPRFLTGSYKKPREFNWNIGVLLLVFTLLLSFTGYLLPDDQLGFWAVTVGTNMARATPLLGHEGPFGHSWE